MKATKNIDYSILKTISAQGVVDLRPLVALCMHACGCSYAEIGLVFNIRRQMAYKVVKRAQKDLNL